MAYQVIKQPDGNLCIFSTFTDSIIAIDMTKEDVIELFVEKERKRLEQSIGEICDQLDKGEEPYFQFTKTFKEAVRYHFSSKQIDDEEYNARIRTLQKQKKESSNAKQ